jgi:hypothetical protein
MNKGRVGEERGGKETDRCPLIGGWCQVRGMMVVMVVVVVG